MKIQQHIYYIFLFLSSEIICFAQQNPQPHFRNYGTEQGLPSPEVYCAFEDSRGYMWFGTDNGAARYDGYEFETYGAQEGLMSNVIFDIHEDGKGRIWFGSMTGEAFILERDTITPYPFNHLLEKYRGRFSGAGLVYLSKEEIAYFELQDFGILRVDSLGKDTLFRGNLPKSLLILEIKGFSKLCRTPSNWKELVHYEEWYQRQIASNFFLIEYFSEKRSFQKRLKAKGYAGTTGLNTQKISNSLLVFGHDYLYCLQDTIILWSIPFYDGISEIIEVENGEIWLCLPKGKGLRRYENLEALKNNHYDQYLNGLSITNFYEDSKKGYWVTSQEKGVFYLPDINLLTYNTAFGFSTDLVHSVNFKNENELFAGMRNGEIVHFDVKENKIIEVINNFRLYSNFDLFIDKESNVLYSSFAKWENEKWVNPKAWDARLKRYVYSGSGLYKMQEFSKNELIGLNQNGLLFLDKNTHIITLPIDESKKERAFGAHKDFTNRLWIGNANGLFEFKDSVLIHCGIAHPAFHHRVEDIDELPDSALVFGTKGFGVMVWKGEYLQQVNSENGLSSNMLEDVHVDENGILWAGTLNGLNKITFDNSGKPKVRSFTMSNGLPSNEIYQVKSYKGQVWLCTAKGLVKFHEAEIDTLAAVPIIQSVRVNDQEIRLAKASKYKYNNNNLTFQYLAINYRQNGEIPYRYRIRKKDNWQYTQSLTVNYPALTAGDYTFEVQAQNQDDFWSESTTYSFEVLPPWWGTAWFRLLSLGLIFGIGYWFYKYRTNQLAKENIIQQEMTNLERSALQAQMNPHFIFNCLNSIQNYILRNDQKKAVEFLSRFARLVRLNLNASVDGEISLEEEISLLENYLVLEQERFEHRFDYKIEVAEGLRNQFVEFPPMLIQPYVENAVIHGLSKTEGSGRVTIYFSSNENELLVSIRDNGLGFRKKENGSKEERHKSVGMSITRKRLAILDADGENPVQIRTLKDEAGVVLGTEVNIRIRKRTKR